jgi:hypothetical protein
LSKREGRKEGRILRKEGCILRKEGRILRKEGRIKEGRKEGKGGGGGGAQGGSPTALHFSPGCAAPENILWEEERKGRKHLF